VSFAVVILCVASQRVFTVVSVYFVVDSVRKLLDTSSYYLVPDTVSYQPLGWYNAARHPISMQ
jgi:hypothetical protein